MSVELRSCFSYQVAAGSTMSLISVVEVIRKSADSSRSSLPSGLRRARPPRVGAGCRAARCRARCAACPAGGAGSTRRPWPTSRAGWSATAPACAASSRCVDIADRRCQRTLVQLAGHPFRRATRVAGVDRGARLIGHRQRVGGELRIERHPAQPCRLRDGVGGVRMVQHALREQAGRPARSSSIRRCATDRCACTRTMSLVASAAGATNPEHWPADPAGDRAALLADVVGPNRRRCGPCCRSG